MTEAQGVSFGTSCDQGFCTVTENQGGYLAKVYWHPDREHFRPKLVAHQQCPTAAVAHEWASQWMRSHWVR